MIKTAIFVEGQTELIFVREMLLKMFEWQNISIECYTLFVDHQHHPTEYAFPSTEAAWYFQINNVGNDKGLVTRIKNREKYLWNSGFSRIVGLRDMYSKEYKEIKKQNIIDPAVNLKFINGYQEQIRNFSERYQDIYFHFAIMETEAWILGFKDIFQKINPDLTNEKIAQELGFNLNEIDPELYFFHPVTNLQAIFQLSNDSYDKSKGDVNKLMSYIEKEDFDYLATSDKCESFRTFFRSVDYRSEAE